MSARSDVTRILDDLSGGDPQSAAKLLPLVYEELRRLAHQKLRHEPPGLTLQATALVHEAFVRLVGEAEARWDARGHFFAAAAEAMRRILVERARRYQRLKHGAGRERVEFEEAEVPEHESDSPPGPHVDVLVLDQALSRLEEQNPIRGQVFKLRCFAGLTIQQTADALGISPASVKRQWNYARAWLCHEITQDGTSES